MGAAYLLIALVPLIVLLGVFLGFVWLFLSGRRKGGAPLLLVALTVVAFAFTDDALDTAIGLLLPCALAAGFVASLFRSGEIASPVRRFVIPVACAAGLFVTSLSPQRLDVSLHDRTFAQADTLRFDIAAGPWPMTGPVGITYDEPVGSFDADYRPDAPSGRLMLGEKPLPVGTSTMAVPSMSGSGRFLVRIHQEPGFWQGMTSLRPALSTPPIEIAILDAYGDTGRKAAQSALREAILLAFGERYVPFPAYDLWSWGTLSERDGSWCLSGELAGRIPARGSACIAPGGVDGRQGGYRVADATDVRVELASPESRAELAALRASMDEAVAMFRARHPDRADREAVYLSDREVNYDPTWIRFEPGTGEWSVYLPLIAPSGGVEDFSYRLRPDGGIVLE